MKTIFAIFAGALLCGCGHKTAVIPQPEYTNSIAGELEMQKRIAAWAYAYGKAETTIDYEQDKLKKMGTKLLYDPPLHSESDLLAQVSSNFWYLRTNSEARSRIK